MSPEKPSQKPKIETGPDAARDAMLREADRESAALKKSLGYVKESKQMLAKLRREDKMEAKRKKSVKDYEWLSADKRRPPHHRIGFETRREEQKTTLKDLFDSPLIKIRVGQENRGHPSRKGGTYYAERGDDGQYYFIDGKKERVKVFSGDVVVPGERFSPKMREEYIAQKEFKGKKPTREAFFVYQQISEKAIPEDLLAEAKLVSGLDNPIMWENAHKLISSVKSSCFSKQYVENYKKEFGEYPKVFRETALADYIGKLGLSSQQQEYLLANLLRRNPKFDITDPSNKNLVRRVAKEYKQIASIPKKGKETFKEKPVKFAKRSRHQE